MRFADYQVLETSLLLRFEVINPGTGAPEYYATVTDEELNNIVSLADFKNLILVKLRGIRRQEWITSRLDALIGQKINI